MTPEQIERRAAEAAEGGEILASEGLRIPSGRIARTAEWAYLMSGTDRLIDLLARERFTSMIALVPADEAAVSGTLAMAITRQLARSSVARARVLAAGWEQHAEALTEACRPSGWIAGSWYARRYAEAMERYPKVTPGQTMNASLDPQALHYWSRRWEAKGSAILRAVGERSMAPDVRPVHRFRLVATPDAVAYRGEQRYALPKPCRYGRNGLQAGVEAGVRAMFAGDAAGVVSPYAQPISEALTTDLAWQARYLPAPLPALSYTTSARLRLAAQAAGVRQACEHRVPMIASNERRGWRGHQRIVWTTAPKQASSNANRATKRAAKRAAAGATVVAKGGRIAGPWTLSDRSLLRASQAVAEAAAAIEAALRRAGDHEQVTFPGGVIVTVWQGAQVTDEARGRAYPIREWSRRAALAGVRA